MPQHLDDSRPDAPQQRRASAGPLSGLAVRFRRWPLARRRLVVGVSAGASLVLVAALVAPAMLSGGNTSGAETATRTEGDTTVVTPASTVNATAVTAISATTGSVAGGSTLTVSGVDVDLVTRVVFGEQEAQILAATSTEVTVAVPAAASFTPAEVGVAVYADDLRVDGDALSYNYDITSTVDAQMAYVFRHWNDYNLDEYGSLVDTDCANFASQSLIERGWVMSDEWWAEGAGDDFDFSSAWVSSTAFMNYAADHPELATALDDTQRDQVKVGDIVQFDWDNSGDRDHTGIVSKVEQTDAGIVISYAGHTDDTDYRTVDEAITVIHPGASVYYWSIA